MYTVSRSALSEPIMEYVSPLCSDDLGDFCQACKGIRIQYAIPVELRSRADVFTVFRCEPLLA